MADRPIIETGVGLIGLAPVIRTDEGKLRDKVDVQLSDFLEDVAGAINGGISFGDGTSSSQAGNIDGQWVPWTFQGVANTEDQIPHGLGRVPTGYLVVRSDRACRVYDSNYGQWSPTSISLKCDTASAWALLLVF